MKHSSSSEVQAVLRQHITQTPSQAIRFFKVTPGSYAEHDRFLGVTVPHVRKVAKMFSQIDLHDIQGLLLSPFNEERLLGLFVLIMQYERGNEKTKEIFFEFYQTNIAQVNNWNLVDASAHLIIGAHLENKERSWLLTLARSTSLWERRIAIIATWHFIRNNDLDWTFKIAEELFNDKEDLIHKATGWMLREAGKKDEERLVRFLAQHASKMPKTMIRYAQERLKNR